MPETPRVTVTGQVDHSAEQAPVSLRREPSRSVQVAALLAAAAIGFGVAQLRQAQSRHRATGPGIALEQSDGTASLQAADRDAVLLRLPVRVRNTGAGVVQPREVLLDDAATATDAGPELPAGSSRVLLVGVRVPCPDAAAAMRGLRGVLRVRARTAEARTQLPDRLLDSAREQVLAACGALPGLAALTVDSRGLITVQARRAVVDVAVTNGSTSPLVIQSVTAAPGLAAELLLTDDAAAPLPQALPAGDFQRPRLPGEEPPPPVRLRVRVTVTDCKALPPQTDQQPLIEFGVRDDTAAASNGYPAGAFGTYPIGAAGPVADRLRQAACPS